jgi:hypothetical protein
MNRTIRFRTIAALSALIAYAVAAPAGAAGPFDGTYRGTATNLVPGGAGCWPGGPMIKRVVDSKFTMPWPPSEMKLTVAPDGTISGTVSLTKALATGTGKITGNTMALEVGGQRCRYRFEGQKSG